MVKPEILLIFLSLSISNGFTPSRNLEILSEFIDFQLENATSVSETLTHMDILEKGFLKSIEKYFKQNQSLIKVWNSTELKHKCNINVVLNKMHKAVASVDSDFKLKNLPWAHFDANTFSESNSHVSKLFKNILDNVLIYQKYELALTQIGQVLHTIQDFYSHSNWIEMGNFNEINKNIGNENSDFDIVNEDDIGCLSESCTKKVIHCKYLKSLSRITEKFSLILPWSCPIVYFECKDNVIQTKLTSGFYTGQRLPNGDRVIKPLNSSKCSHGGVLDKSSFVSSYGGINKDTGFFFLSPRADLHSKAANLAIQHTENFFDTLRAEIGNINFDLLFRLNCFKQDSKFYSYFKNLI